MWYEKNDLYMIDGYFHSTARTNIDFVINTDMIALWHLKLGHIGPKGLQVLFKQGFVGKIYVNSCFL